MTVSVAYRCVQLRTWMLRRALCGAKLYWDMEEAESWSGSTLWDSIPKGGHSNTHIHKERDREGKIERTKKLITAAANILQYFPVVARLTLGFFEDTWSVPGPLLGLL